MLISYRTRAWYRCAIADCPFRIRASFRKKLNLAVVVSMKSEHTCHGTVVHYRAIANNHKWLKRAVPKSVAVTSETKATEIMNTSKFHNVGVNYGSAKKVRDALLGNESTERQCQYRLLPDYLWTLSDANPDCDIKFSLGTDDQRRFYRVFICPSAISRDVFSKMRKIIAVDGTHLKGGFIHTLLLAVGLDSNNEVYILAWAIVASETAAAWE